MVSSGLGYRNDGGIRGPKDLQDKAHLQETRTQLQQTRDSPRPVTSKAICAEAYRRGGDLPDEIGHVEQRCQHGALLGIGELADEGGAGDDACRDAKAQNHTRDNVHGHFYRGQFRGSRWPGGGGMHVYVGTHRAVRNLGSTPQ